MNCKARILLLIVVLSNAAFADKPWRSYEVYQPEITRHFVANPVLLDVKYNDYSCLIWYKGNWYCFWTGKVSADAPAAIYFSESQDAKRWSAPAACFIDRQYCENPVKAVQTRPVAIEYDGKLLVFWSALSLEDGKPVSSYISYIEAVGEKWQNKQLLWNDKPLPNRDGMDYTVSFKSNPLILQNRRILVPVVLTAVVDKMPKIACVMFSDDGGSSWEFSREGVDIDAAVESVEAAVWQEHQTSQSLSMLLSCGISPEFRKYEKIPEQANQMLWASSRDGGINWSLPTNLNFDGVNTGISAAVPYEYAAKPLDDDRVVMVFNDSKYRNKTMLRDHLGLAMFFNRGGGFDFTAGNSITPKENFTMNPYISIRGDRLITSYTQGVNESAIKVAHITNLPLRDKSYIYPRTPAVSNSLRPALIDESHYHFDGIQYVKTERDIVIDENGFSGVVWFRGDFEGLIFDNLNEEQNLGFRWYIDRNKITLTFPGIGDIVSENIRQEFIYWTNIGFTLDALRGTVDFYLNGKNIESIDYDKDKLETLSGDSGFIGYKQGLEGFSGDIKFLGFYNQMFETAQHRHMYNIFAEGLRLPYISGKSVMPQKAVFELDPEKAAPNGSLEGFEFPEYNKDGIVEIETVSGRNIIRFFGQASAGIDIDTNDRRYGDYLQVEFAFMIESKEHLVLCSLGDSVNPVQIVSRDNCLYLSLGGNEQIIGEVRENRWQTIVIFSGGGITRAKIGNNRFRQISHTPQATWMYLGQGWRDESVSPNSHFAIDISTVRTRIIRQ